ncbi:ATP-binding domain-containing protein [Pseudonocardia sp. NPDC049635]|uniref:ATP-binding domain-containing protein n=1 Tax=Pseudonocardia sp. NPDC049635 TaxID=3155506 RepID=UPI0034032AF6
MWALTSAALGNFRNRRTFNDVFWWADASDPAPGMKVRLERAGDEAEPARDAWHAAVRSFRTAHHRVQALVAERQQVVDALHRAPGTPMRHADLAGKVQAARAGLATSEYRLRDAERECDRAQLAAVDAELAEHETTRPGWWARLVTFGQATRAWRAEQAALDGRRRRAADRESAAAEVCGSAATAMEVDRVTVSAALRTLRAEEEVAERGFVLGAAVGAAAKKRLRHQIREERIGTVHTVQGKEAPVVILVLGGGERGRDWAATRPNLLNAAVSRAKHRLYVIGDRTDRRRRRYFSTAARHLPIGDAR